jgi:carboxyl-terminal processing protease
MVVLIDGDTASASEVLAGALKENNRARLVGKNTFGKGCTQTLFRLPPGPSGAPTGGLRVTITRFFSPTGRPYSGRGVAPHLTIERLASPDAMDTLDAQLAEALLETQRLVEMGHKASS